MLFRAFIFVLLIGISDQLAAQQTFSISGTVKDHRETLPGAGVYVSGHKISTVTDNSGKFIIRDLKPGSYEVLVQMIGYQQWLKKLLLRTGLSRLKSCYRNWPHSSVK